MVDIIGTTIALVLVINFIVQGNVHAALGWGMAALLFSKSLRRGGGER